MRAATDQINSLQILVSIMWASMQHLSEIVGHVECSPVVNLETCIPIVRRNDLLESDSLFDIFDSDFGQSSNHVLSIPIAFNRPIDILVLTGNRGLCGGYNSNVVRQAMGLLGQWSSEQVATHVTVSGKRGISALRFRKATVDESYTNFEDKPAFDEVAPIGQAYLDAYCAGTIDRLDVVYTQFTNIAKQDAVVETLLPLKPPQQDEEIESRAILASEEYDFYPSAESILEEILPASFQSRLFKCFLDAAVSEQVARMVAMKGATENASGLIRDLSRQYNRARQSQITGEIMEILGGVEALKQ